MLIKEMQLFRKSYATSYAQLFFAATLNCFFSRTRLRKNMELSSGEQALVVAALSSHEFKLKRQMSLFRKGLDDVLRAAAESEIDAASTLKDKILRFDLDNN